MSLNDSIANALSKIKNAENVGKSTCEIFPISNLLKETLSILQEEGYVGSFEINKDNRGETIVLNLLGKINNCGAIKPRSAITLDLYEKFEKRYLPARNFGVLLISTSQGLMIHNKAKDKKIGGKLIAYCY